MEREIVHLRVDSFPVAVERLCDSSLRHWPVAICARHSPRALVYAVSPEARAEGVHEKLPLHTALRRCPRLIVRPPNEKLYRRASDAMQKSLQTFSPLVEPGSWGRFFVDLSGTTRLYGPVQNTAMAMQKAVMEQLCLAGRIGVASNKLVSRVAARVAAIDDRLCTVPAGREASFLAPMKPGCLPAVRFREEQALLAEFNIQSVSQLAGLALAQLAVIFGKQGRVIHRQALGIDWQPVLPPSSKPFVLEEFTLDHDSNDDAVLLACLYRLVEQGCVRLRQRNELPRTVWLHLRYSDGIDVTRRMRLEQPDITDAVMFSAVKTLFLKIDTRRQRMRYLSLTFTDLAAPSGQMTLFAPGDSLKKERSLIKAMDSVRSRFGTSALQLYFGR